MLEYDFENSVGFWICQSSNVFQRAFNEELAPQGVTFRQAQVLGCLALEGRFTCVDVLNAIHGHIVDEAQLIGTYTLNPALAAEPARKPRKKTA